MSAILNGERFSLRETARLLGVHTATTWRWALRGVRGRKLPTVLVGGRRYVLRTDLEAFLAAGNDMSGRQRPDVEERANEAGEILDVYGIT